MKKSKGKARISKEISEDRRTKASRSKSQAKRTREISEDDEINEERRTKTRNDDFFPSDKVRLRYESDFRRRQIVMGKVVNFNFFEQQGMKLKDMFSRIGWENFIAINQPQYSSLVAMFHCNFECNDDTNQVTSTVMGRKLCFGEDEIARIFKVKRGDIKVYVKKGLIEFDGLVPVEAMRQICGRHNIESFFLPAEFHLSAESRMLHKIVVDCILPRKCSRNYVSYLDFFVMWCILNGKKLDLPYLMIKHMEAVYDKNKISLPYGMALTSVFASHKITLPKADGEKPRKSDIYNESTLKSMRLIYSEEKGCLIKDEKDCDGEDSEDGDSHEALQDNEAGEHPAVSHEAGEHLAEDNEAGEHSAGPSVAANPMITASLQLLLTKIAQLDEKVTEKFQTIETRFNDLQSELLNMDKKLSEKLQHDNEVNIDDLGTDVYLLKEKGNALFELADRKFTDQGTQMGKIGEQC